MKKLIMACAVIATAMFANAAAVSWKSGTIALPDSSTAGKNDVTAYLFLVNQSTYNTYAAAASATALSDAVWANYGGASITGYDATKSSTAKGAANLDSGGDYAADTTLYGVVLYTTTVGTDTYYMGNVASVTVEGTMDAEVTDLAVSLGYTSGSTAWSTAAVPEPTSGLLMLLGLAGLALKRKRA